MAADVTYFVQAVMDVRTRGGQQFAKMGKRMAAASKSIVANAAPVKRTANKLSKDVATLQTQMASALPKATSYLDPIASKFKQAGAAVSNAFPTFSGKTKALGIRFQELGEKMGSTLPRVSSTLGEFGNKFTRVGDKMRTALPSLTGSLLNLRTAFIGLLGAYGIVSIVKGALDANRQMENLAHTTATTFQLFARNKSVYDGVTGAIIGQRDATAQFAQNLEDARYVIDQIFRIAATSPASFQQAQTLYRNLIPGLAQVETSLDKQLDFLERALSVGTLLTGDFKQAGADLRRILTGQAGMDVRAWAEGMSSAIARQAGQMGGTFVKLGALQGDSFTKTFNKMSGADRYELVKRALADLQASTAAAGKTWDGMASAIKSAGFLIQKAFGEALFGSFKERMSGLISEGGLFDLRGERFKSLEMGARIAGTYLADAGSWIADKLEGATDYLSNNWTTVFEKLSGAFDKGILAAKLLIAARTTSLIGGAAVGGAGAAVRGVGKGAGILGALLNPGKWDASAERFRLSSGKFAKSGNDMVRQFATLLGSMGNVKIMLSLLAPLAVLLAAAMGGLLVAFGGVVAYFVQNWSDLVTSIGNGTVSIEPLTTALGHLWAKMVALGATILGVSGTTGATSTLTQLIMVMTEAVFALTGAMSFMLRAAGVVAFVFNSITTGFRLFVVGVYALLGGLGKAVHSLYALIPGHENSLGAAGAKEFADMMFGAAKNVTADIDQDTKDAYKFFEYADAFDAAYDKRSRFAMDLEGRLKKAAKASADGTGPDGKQPPTRPAKQVTIHNLTVTQDLRNHDPDRILGAFVNKLERVTNNPTQAMTQEDYGQ